MKEFEKHIQTVEASLSVRLNSMKKYNIVINDKRTSITLEPIIWEILHDIAEGQGCKIHDLCSFIENRKKTGANLSSAIRVFIIAYLFIRYKEPKK